MRNALRSFLQSRALRRQFGSIFSAVMLRLPSAGWRLLRLFKLRRRISSELRRPRVVPPARLELIQNIPVLHVYGTPTEMGRQHGTILRTALQSLEEYILLVLPTSQRDQLLAMAEDCARELAPEMREELQAMADASGVPFDHLLALNVLPHLACTCVAAWGDQTTDGKMLLGRNCDYFGFGLGTRAGMLVIYHPKDEIPVASANYLGMVGCFTAMNSTGVALGNLLVFNAREDWLAADGEPIQLVLRLAAQRSDTVEKLRDASAAHQRLRPAILAIADAQQAFVVELGLHQAAARSETNPLLTSNYFTHPELLEFTGQCERYAALAHALERHRGRIDASVVQKALYAARYRGINLHAAVFVPADLAMYLSINQVPAAKGPYVRLDLRELFERPPA